LDSLTTVLAEEELSRANRYALPRDRQHFVVARSTLRLLLGRYLKADPASLQIRQGARQKPYVLEKLRTSSLRFNLSHSKGLALFAFALGKELGIDLEQVCPDAAKREIAERYFSHTEVAELNALAPPIFAEGFFTCWTRKEAYVKARGSGLEIPLNSFSVSLTPGEPVELTARDSLQWSLYSFRPSAGFVAAIAAERSEWNLSFYDASGMFLADCKREEADY
jgi:4'-phosphopantetheinyl transferase